MKNINNIGGGATPGFTLAEVLITLGIIGVVAALTMPTLISNHQKKVFAVRAKKAYSVISQAIKLYQAKEESPGDVTGLFDTGKTSAQVAEAFSQYFETVKKCFGSSSGCSSYKVNYTTPLYNESSVAMSFTMTPNYRPYFILKDGTLVAIRQYDSCDRIEYNNEFNSDGSIKTDESGTPVVVEQRFTHCADIFFDTNGQQSPNQFGMDVFALRVSADGRYIKGWDKAGWDNLVNIMAGNDFAVTKYNSGDKLGN